MTAMALPAPSYSVQFHGAVQGDFPGLISVSSSPERSLTVSLLLISVDIFYNPVDLIDLGLFYGRGEAKAGDTGEKTSLI